MTTEATDRIVGLNKYFAASEARVDRWRTLNRVAKAPGGARHEPKELLANLDLREEQFAYPGPLLMTQVRERLMAGDGTGFARLVQRISAALLSTSYRDDPGPWTSDEDDEAHVLDILPPAIGRGQARRPYFEVLYVSPGDACWCRTSPALVAEIGNVSQPTPRS